MIDKPVLYELTLDFSTFDLPQGLVKQEVIDLTLTHRLMTYAYVVWIQDCLSPRFFTLISLDKVVQVA